MSIILLLLSLILIFRNHLETRAIISIPIWLEALLLTPITALGVIAPVSGLVYLSTGDKVPYFMCVELGIAVLFFILVLNEATK